MAITSNIFKESTSPFPWAFGGHAFGGDGPFWVAFLGRFVWAITTHRQSLQADLVMLSGADKV